MMYIDKLHQILFENLDTNAAAVIIEIDGKILMLRRGKTAPWMPGKWNLPGGTIEKGEDPIQTAERETKEEVNIATGPLRLIGNFEYDKSGSKVAVYHSTSYDGEPKLNIENDRMKWVSKSDVLKLDIVPGISQAIQKIS